MEKGKDIPQNRIKIVSNPIAKTLTFFLLNEKGKWCPVSNYSDLSRSKYTSSSIFETGEDIVSVIDRVYNTGRRGVDIRFEGPEDEYAYLQQCIATLFADKVIECNRHEAKIAVAGKIHSGKTTLIEEINKLSGGKTSSSSHPRYEQYVNYPTNTTWYEIEGIDIGKENVIAVQKTIDSLLQDGVTDFLYCLSTTKIEELEENLLTHIRINSPKTNIAVLLTQYLDDDSDLFIEQLSAHLNGIKVLPILARSLKTRNGIVEAFGLNDVSKFLFEGK